MKKYPTSIMALRSCLMLCIGLPLGLLLLPSAALSQAFDYGNAWYNPATNYVRFEVSADGIYRVTPQQMIQNGLDTAGLDPANLHVVYRGREQYVYIHPDGSNWDYLEFFGKRNDGGLDTLLYRDAYTRVSSGRYHPNPHISTFSDKSVYYCYASNQPGLRLSTPQHAPGPPPFVWERYDRTGSVEYLPNQGATFTWQGIGMYDIFQTLNPHWVTGEGYEGQSFGLNNDIVLQIPTPHHLPVDPPKLHLRMAGMNAFYFYVEVTVDGYPVLQDTIHGYDVIDTTVYCNHYLQGDTTTVVIHGAPIQSGVPGDHHYLNLATLTYPGTTSLDGAATTTFQKGNTDSYYKFRHIAPGTEAVCYDFLNSARLTDSIQGDSLVIWIPGLTFPSHAFLSSDGGITSPTVSPGLNSQLSVTSNGADMVLITSRALANSALAYQAFRQSSFENPLNVHIVYTDEIYNEFGYGSPHPLAIKRFIKYALDHWAVQPSYFLLWGRGKADIRIGGINHVPLYGMPASDILYVTTFLRGTFDIHPEAAIGRVPVRTDAEGMAYVAKLQTYEEHVHEPWNRNGVFISAAQDSAEYKPIHLYMDTLSSRYQSAPIYGRRLDYGLQDSTVMATASISCEAAINQGAGLVTFFGKPPYFAELFQLSNFQNATHFPLLVEMGSTFPDYLADTLSLEEKWVMAPAKGAIGVLAYNGPAYLIPLGLWSGFFGREAFTQHPNASVGLSMAEAIDTMISVYTDIVFANHAYGMNLLGDPSMVMHTGTFAVWPGDTDDDLLANNQDLLNIGIAFGDTGAVRPNASLAWTAQPATLWDSTFVTSVNHVHADCDGNGTVEAADTAAILQNYGLAHNKTIGQLDGGPNDPELAIETVVDSLQDSSVVNLIVRLGSALQPADSAYGIAWSVYYNPLLVDSASVHVSFDSCWLGNLGSNLLTLQRHFHDQGRIEFAITRTDHQPISGYGELLRIGIVVIDNISGRLPGDTTASPALFVPGDARLVDPQGHSLPMRGLAKRLWVTDVVAEPAMPADRIAQVYPNPVRNELYVQTRSEGSCMATLTDLSGRVLLRQSLGGGLSKRLAMGSLPVGVYLLKLENADGTFQAKVMKAD